MFRIDGVLDPWVEHLLEVLLQHYPLPLPLAQEQDTIPADRPPPRVSIGDVTSDAILNPYPLDEDEKYHTASVKCNKRTTAEDWFQDVRHFEFSFKEDIKYWSWSFLSATAYSELQIRSWRCRCGSSVCSCVRS
jgi:sulfite reductase alpha subunit-like flavoprotein